MALVVWSYPGEKYFNALESDEVLLDSLAELRTPVFVARPFLPEEPYRILPAARATKIDSAGKWLADRLVLTEDTDVPPTLPNYQQMVKEAVDLLSKKAGIQKLVLSRHVDEFFEPRDLAWVDQLKAKYPNAFVCVLSTEELGTWAMASPELFLSRQGKKIQSFALAGTQIGNRTQLGDKEHHEQGLVTEYIRDVFVQNGLSPNVLDETLQSSGELKHILNRIEAQVGDETAIDTLLKQLHPTPAVGGLPRKKALDHILANEGYDRGLYAGFVGLWQSVQQFSFFVNLRSCQLFKNKVRLYAGAGIVQSSDPQAEWEETAAKMEVLRSVIKN